MLAVCGCGGGGSASEAEAKRRPIPKQSPAQAARRAEPKVVVPRGAPPSKLVVRDLVLGAGRPAKAGDVLTVEYAAVSYAGKPFTNSWERAKPFRVHLGAGEVDVSPGWEKGLPGMRAGGRRELIVPPGLLFRGGAPPGVKPSDSLVYVIDLLSVR